MNEERYFLEAQASALNTEIKDFKAGLDRLEELTGRMKTAWDCRENQEGIDSIERCAESCRELTSLAEAYRAYLLNSADA